MVTSGLTSVWNLFSGFLVPEPDIPKYYLALHYLNPFRYALAGIGREILKLLASVFSHVPSTELTFI